MTRKLLLTSMIPLLFWTLFAGCASTGKDMPIQDGVDIVWLEKGQQFPPDGAPARGAFVSDKFYKFQFERCGDHP